MEIQICSMAEFGRLPPHEERAIISIGDPGETNPLRNVSIGRRGLRLAFHDVTGPVPGAKPPSPKEIRRLVAFARRHADDELLVHCHAGISRSTAAATIALVAWGARPADALAKVVNARPQARPMRSW